MTKKGVPNLYSGPCYIPPPRYIATLAYRHEIVKNEFPPMLIPPL